MYLTLTGVVFDSINDKYAIMKVDVKVRKRTEIVHLIHVYVFFLLCLKRSSHFSARVVCSGNSFWSVLRLYVAF